jgi:hypothetical protein
MLPPALRAFALQSLDRSLKAGENLRGRVAVTVLKLVVRGQRLRVANQFLAKLPFGESLANQPAHDRLMEGNNDISIEAPKWFLAERLRQRMLAIEALCPDVNDVHLIAPRFECLNRAREIFMIGFADYGQLSPRR